MSQYNSQKPLRLPPCDYPKWRYGEGAKISTCHYCICTLCTGAKCRIKHRSDRCTSCIINNDKMPVVVCDDFSMRSSRRLKVERKYSRYQQLIDILQGIYNRLDVLEGKKDE